MLRFDVVSAHLPKQSIANFAIMAETGIHKMAETILPFASVQGDARERNESAGDAGAEWVRGMQSSP